MGEQSTSDSRKANILAVDDNSEALFTLQSLLEHHGYGVETATNGAEAILAAQKFLPDLILMDVNMPEMDGLQATSAFKQDPQLRFIPVILVTSQDDFEDITKGLAHGADDYIRKPYSTEEILGRLQAVLHTKKLYEELQSSLRAQQEDSSDSVFEGIIGKSEALHQVFDLIRKARNSDVPVLITGDSGVGKELIARAVHLASNRAERRFVVQNCSAFQESLLESELFGHVKGAFTGAIKDKQGLFEIADKGTFFLDELGEMSAALQAKLLRVLQEGTFTPVGATDSKHVDVRIVAATHRNLPQMIEEGTFREDLYYRLNVLQIDVPPLRERKEDIELLAKHFLEQVARKQGREPKRLSEEALTVLKRYAWPGNIRELRNEIERMDILAENNSYIPLSCLSPKLLTPPVTGRDSSSEPLWNQEETLKDATARLERSMIEDALQRLDGNKSEAARILGISRSSLITKVKTYELE